MNKVQHELATNHQRAHSMPAGSFYNRNQLHHQKEGGFPISNSTKRRHPVNMTDALFFGMTQTHIPIYQQNQSNSCQVELRCKVDRGFFLCDQHWTCYRRNYFQLTTAFTTNCNENQGFYIQNSQHSASTGGGGDSSSVSDEQNNRSNSLVQIEAFFIQLLATTSEGNQRVELIQLTAKRDKGPQHKPSMLPIQPGDGLLLQYPHDNSQRTVTYERLQFKSATANNGKKRATQQYFYLTTQLIAQDINHHQHVIASSQSSPLVVRGRSPGHYADTDQRHQTSPLARATSKTKRKRNTNRGENGNKGNQHEAQQDTTTITTTTADKEINAPIPPSPSSLSPIPMSIVPIMDSNPTASMPNTNNVPPFIQQQQHGTATISHHHHHHPSSSSISSSSISPSSSPPQLPLQPTPEKDIQSSVSSSSILSLQAHPSSAMITPTIPSDATSSSMIYMNGPPPAFNPHGRSFSANDSVWRLQQYDSPHHHHHQQQQQQHQQQQQQVHDTWSGMHMMTPTWMERQRTDSVATFGSYVTPEESVMSSRSPYATRQEFPSPPSTTTTSHHLDSQSMPPPPPTTLSNMAMPQSNNDNKNTTKSRNDPSATTTYLLYPNTPWDARQQHGHLTNYNQGETK